jgi:hypothetical protein
MSRERRCDVCDGTMDRRSKNSLWKEWLEIKPKALHLWTTPFGRSRCRLDICTACWSKFSEWVNEQLAESVGEGK